MIDLDAKQMLKLMYRKGYARLPEKGVTFARNFFEPNKKNINCCWENYFIASHDHEIPIRHYYLDQKTTCKSLLIYFHGGGFVVGGLNHADWLCGQMVSSLPCDIIAIAYRLAPEHKFPTALYDAQEAVQHLIEHAKQFGSYQQIVLIGESSGGNISATLSQMNKICFSNKIAGQILICPSLDYYNTYPSKERYRSGYLLDKKVRDWFVSLYLDDEDQRKDLRISPILNSRINDLPPVLIITAEYDPLKDEAEAYAMKLIDSNINCTYVCMLGKIHGFVHMVKLELDLSFLFNQIRQFIS